MAFYNRQGARRALLHTAGLRLISQIGAFLAYIVLVRALSEASLGVYSLLYSVIPVIQTIASLGLDQVLKRYQPQFLQAGNHAASDWLLRYVSIARLVSSVALLLLLYLGWNFVAPLLQLQGHRVDFALLGVVIVLYFQLSILQASMASHMLHRYSVGSAVVLSLGKLFIYLLMLQQGGLTLRQAILADTAAFILTYSFIYIAHRFLCRYREAGEPFRPSPDEFSRMRRYAVLSNFSDAGSLLLFVQTDNFFIAALLNPIAVGTYAFYTKLNEMTLNLIPVRFFENVIYPLFFATRAEQASQRLPQYFTLLVNINLLAQLPLVAYSIAYHREIVQLVFGGKFLEYSPLLPLIVTFAISDNVFSIPVTMVAQYSEKASLILKSQLFGLYQIAAMLALIPLAGLYGAAIATGTLHLLRNTYVWWRLRSLAHWLNWFEAVAAGVLIWGLAVAVCLSIKWLTDFPPVVNMACGVVICALTGIAYVRSRAISKSDRELLGDVLHGREAWILRWVGILPRNTNPPT
jgi:O-antigen/teichoic acid export membrane protein